MVHHADFTHAVIGGGAVGLAIARRLQQVEGAQVVVIEKHGMVGSETSSRNSEVSRKAHGIKGGRSMYSNAIVGNTRRPVLRSRHIEDKSLHTRQANDVRSMQQTQHTAYELWQMDRCSDR